MDNAYINIRKALPSDCDEIYEIEKSCFSDAWSKESIMQTMANPNAMILIALVDDKISGFINLTYVVGELTINNIAVMPDYRQRGIADRLITSAFDEFPSSEIAMLEVRASNSPAQKLYKKHGFYTVGKRKNYYQSPVEDAWLMTKDMKNGQE